MEGKIYRTPDGFGDLLNDDCSIRLKVEESIRGVFKSFGYMEVDTPALEYYDLFTGSVDTLPQQRMFKLFDSNGRILVIRPDMTVPMMRMALGKMDGFEYPLKLSCFGDVFRNDIKNNISCQYRQADIEIIGAGHISADAEAIAIAIQSMIKTGVDYFRIDIGQVKLFKALTSDIDDAGLLEDLRQAVSEKNKPGLLKLLDNINIDDQKKEGLISLPWLFGSIEVLDEAAELFKGIEEIEAIAELKNLIDILKSWGYEKYLSVDLGMVQSLNYYSSIVFRAYTDDCGFSICWGGRYDKLSGNFGKKVESTGCALGINRIVEILRRKGRGIEMKGADYLVATLLWGFRFCPIASRPATAITHLPYSKSRGS